MHFQSLSGDSRSALAGRNVSNAFTLIELLVVIAVFAILAALLLSVIAGVKRKSQQANCVHNLGQLGIALQGFVADNHMYPLEANVQYAGGGSPESLTGWKTALQNELSKSEPVRTTNRWFEKGVWDCPAAQRPSDLPKSMGYVDYGYNSRGVFSLGRDRDSLGLGGHQGPATSKFVDTSAVRDSEIVNPTDMMAIADSFMGNGTNIMDGGGFWRTPEIPHSWSFWPNNQQVAKRTSARHLGKANVAFCDGHVESSTLKSLFEDTSDAALSRWNRDHRPHFERLMQ